MREVQKKGLRQAMPAATANLQK